MGVEPKFYRCERCGNVITKIKDSGVKVVCCGQPMTELVPNTVEASQEKHLPVVMISGNQAEVNIGSAPHPMLAEHFINWVYLQTAQGGQLKYLTPGGTPVVQFALTADDKAIAAYAYCNLHGLWKTSS